MLEVYLSGHIAILNKRLSVKVIDECFILKRRAEVNIVVFYFMLFTFFFLNDHHVWYVSCW